MRHLAHKSRHEITGQARQHRFPQPAHARFRHLEVGGTSHVIEQMQVIGQYTDCEQALRQCRQRFDLVVDPGELAEANWFAADTLPAIPPPPSPVPTVR